MKASDLFVKALENEGVEYIFSVPGEENLDFLDSLRQSNIKLIINRHEQAAGFMAATYGRLTGKPGVCLATLGPGATNLTTSAAFAQLGAMPLVMITGQKPIKKSKQGRFQIVDIVDLMRPITKYTRQIVEGNKIPSMVREAFRIAMEERPGAVHLELPEDIAAEEVSETRVFDVVQSRRPVADDISIEQASKMIEGAKMPLLLIGAAVNREATRIALEEFIKKTGIPFFTTQMGKGVVDERHSNYMGTAALSSNDFLHAAIDSADLIINVGHDIIEKPPFFMTPGGTKVIHINFFPAQIDEVYFPQQVIVGNITDTVHKLTNTVNDTSNWDLSYFVKVKKNVESHLSKYSFDQRFPMLPQRLVQLIRERLPDDGIVTLDNGIYKLWFARNYESYQPNSLLLDNALATMGAGLPSAMMAKLLYPNRKVISVNGDGGFMMNSQELETAVRLNLNLVVIILNDNAYGMIKWKQEGMGLENFGLDFNNPDFIQYAASFGAIGHRPDSDEAFKNCLNKCLDQDGVHVIDLAVDYSLNHSILNVLLKEQTQLL